MYKRQHYNSPSFEQELTFNLKPFSFKHTGIFPEQAANWDWFGKIISDARKKRGSEPVKVLNPVSYTHLSQLSMSQQVLIYTTLYIKSTEKIVFFLVQYRTNLTGT